MRVVCLHCCCLPHHHHPRTRAARPSATRLQRDWCAAGGPQLSLKLGRRSERDRCMQSSVDGPHENATAHCAACGAACGYLGAGPRRLQRGCGGRQAWGTKTASADTARSVAMLASLLLLLMWAPVVLVQTRCLCVVQASGCCAPAMTVQHRGMGCPSAQRGAQCQ